ncbi:hypothetical protein [Halioxenophilus sp. WMMB6]|uniref:hypothetical protein n=1 Tax=Halioxenophilus sp. WMMB6 TaxID=3073815 RepID=UPI00295F4C4B|nr:hypothetical protein [Halioxenophilus sp. WMMB6]
MKQLLGIALIVFSALVHSGSLEDAAALGNELTQSVQSKASTKLKKLANYKEVKSFLKASGCPGFKYTAYILPERSKFYLIATSSKNVIIGRHFVGDIADNLVDVSSLTSSTNGCLNMGTARAYTVGMFVTHLKPEPNEFHVQESNLAKIALYVRAGDELYSVSEGVISIVEE